MSQKLVNIGFGNSVVSRRVIAIISPSAAPIKRLRDEARDEKRLIDATQGRKTRAVIVTDSPSNLGAAPQEAIQALEQIGVPIHLVGFGGKIAADKIAESFHLSFDLPVVTVRPFNAFGPRQSDRAVVPTIIAQRLADIDPVVIGDARTVRDLTFAADTARAFARAACCDEAVGQTVNVGSGKGISIGELAQVACALTGGGSYRVDERRIRPPKSEVRKLICDSARAERLLDWRPTWTR